MKNRNQYKIWKYRDGGESNAYKIFSSWVEEGNIPNYPVWNCSWLPWKWKIIFAIDASMKCKKAGMEEGTRPIKPLWARWWRKTFQTQYPIQNCSLPWKWKITSAMDTNMKCKKAGIEEGIMPIKSLWAGWWRETFQTQYPIWNCSWLPWKWKVISAMDTNRKCKKAGMEEGIMSLNLYELGGWGKMLYTNKISCLELSIATMKKKQFSELSKK